jgi:hypothetical protein
LLETMWLISTQDGETVQVMDEWGNRGNLLNAFRKYLPGFATHEAKRAIATREKGRWTCFLKNV